MNIDDDRELSQHNSFAFHFLKIRFSIFIRTMDPTNNIYKHFHYLLKNNSRNIIIYDQNSPIPDIYIIFYNIFPKLNPCNTYQFYYA